MEHFTKRCSGKSHKEQLEKAISFVAIIGDKMRELGSVPEDQLYNLLIEQVPSDHLKAALQGLKEKGLVLEENGILRWKWAAPSK